MSRRVIAAGLLVLAAGIGGYDYVQRFDAHTGVKFTSAGEIWSGLHPASLEWAETRLRESAPAAGKAILEPLLAAPVWLVLGLLGAGLFVSVRRRPKPEHSASEQDAGGPAWAAARPVPDGRSELASAMASCRGAFWGVGLFSALSNVLMLTGALFMLQVYDRVLPSRSVPTLVALSILAAGFFIVQGLLDLIRARILVRIGTSLDQALGVRVCEAIVSLSAESRAGSRNLEPVRDLDNVRGFLSGQGPTALFDLPWMPLYLAIIFAFHASLGIVALCGAVALVALTLLADVLTRRPSQAAALLSAARNNLAEEGRRNAEVLTAMGMNDRMGRRWDETNRRFMSTQQRVNDVSVGIGAISRALRMLLQSGVLAVGAFLVIRQEASAGIIIAGAILFGRALAPADVAIANWKGFVAARQSWKRLSNLLALVPRRAVPMPLDAPVRNLTVEGVSVVAPGTQNLVVQDVTVALVRGQGIGVIGPSAAGKSSLARTLVGVWRPVRGRVRLDNATLDQWAPEDLGRHIGYLPQDVELFSGTVAENIARFERDADAEAVKVAARAADLHDLIVGLPDGYDTNIGERGAALSAGQRQRIALARALYKNPFLVVLDEPDANLNSEGEAALKRAILGVRARGGIVVVVAHRPSLLETVDLALALNRGRVVAVGPKDVVLQKVLRPGASVVQPLMRGGDLGGSGT